MSLTRCRALWLQPRQTKPSVNSTRSHARHIASVSTKIRAVVPTITSKSLPSPRDRFLRSVHRRHLTSQPSSPPSSTSFADPDRPDLFYHLFRPPTPVSRSTAVFALSFLAETPATVDSCAVLGWLPAEQTSGQAGEAGLNDFRENGKSPSDPRVRVELLTVSLAFFFRFTFCLVSVQ